MYIWLVYVVVYHVFLRKTIYELRYVARWFWLISMVQKCKKANETKIVTYNWFELWQKNKAVNGDETAKYRYQIPLPTIEYVRVILSMHSLSCGFSLMHWWFVYYCKRRNAISQKMLTSWEETREDVEVWKLEKKKWEEYKRASSGCKTRCEYKGY